MKYYELTKEEQKILNDYDKGALIPVTDSKKRIKLHQQYARHTLNKTKNINLRLSERDLQRLKVKAIEQGIPYQTLAASVLHRFSNLLVS